MSPSMAAVNAELQQQHGGSPPHFLVVAYGIQSHINPCRLLAHRLACLGIVSGSGPVLATLAVPLSAHRRMFPNHPSGNTADSDSDGVISYAPDPRLPDLPRGHDRQRHRQLRQRGAP